MTDTEAQHETDIEIVAEIDIDTDTDSDTTDNETGSKSRKEEQEERLVAEGEIAGDYLEELLDLLDFDGDIDLDVEGDRAVVSIDGGEDLSKLVGRRGEVLDALQELTRLAVHQKTGERSRLMLDVAGWRRRRRDDARPGGAGRAHERAEGGAPAKHGGGATGRRRSRRRRQRQRRRRGAHGRCRACAEAASRGRCRWPINRCSA